MVSLLYFQEAVHAVSVFFYNKLRAYYLLFYLFVSLVSVSQLSSFMCNVVFALFVSPLL